jgi:hypothetical protein
MKAVVAEFKAIIGFSSGETEEVVENQSLGGRDLNPGCCQSRQLAVTSVYWKPTP